MSEKAPKSESLADANNGISSTPLKWLQAIVGVVLVCAAGYGIVALIDWFFVALKTLDTGIAAAIVAGATTVVSSVFIASYNARKARERLAVEANRAVKAKAYMAFMDTIIKVMKDAKGEEGDKHLPTQELEQFFYDFTSTVAVYGGPKVVKAFSNFRSGTELPESTGVLTRVDSLISAMRDDLGESNNGIEINELVGLFIIGGKAEMERLCESASK